jgi:hypothetical protein
MHATQHRADDQIEAGMRVGTREDVENESGMSRQALHLTGIEKEAETGIGIRAGMIVRRKIALDENGNDQGHPGTNRVKPSTMKSKSAGSLEGERTNIAGIEGTGRNLGQCHGHGRGHRSLKGMGNVVGIEARLALGAQSKSASLPNCIKTTDAPIDELPPQHPTLIPSKPSSAHSHLPNPPYAPKGAAPIKQTTWVLSRASLPHMIPPQTFAKTLMWKMTGAMLWKRCATVLAGSNKVLIGSRLRDSRPSK